jgi:CheY-like chemotaxis protein
MKLRLGIAIRNKRSEMGISQEELADRAGLHRTYISDIERGARNPSLESIDRLARALEISLPVLFERATDQNGGRELVSILLIEDDPRDVELTRRAFKKARIRNPMHVVRDGAEALDYLFGTGPCAQRAKERHPQVILLDLNLPKINGIEVLRRIKADNRTREIPVVILTISNQDGDMAECRRLGAEIYIVKPLGFHNFSEAMPGLQFDWALLKPSVWVPLEASPQGAT